MDVYVESLLNGLMVYWNEVKNAVRYYVHLLIGDKHQEKEIIQGMQTYVYGKETFLEIAVVEIEWNIKYYSFTNLAKIEQEYPPERLRHRKDGYSRDYSTGKNYYIYVEAEYKNGNIIFKSEKVEGSVFVSEHGCYSLFY